MELGRLKVGSTPGRRGGGAARPGAIAGDAAPAAPAAGPARPRAAIVCHLDGVRRPESCQTPNRRPAPSTQLASLRRYAAAFALDLPPDATKDDMVDAITEHWDSQVGGLGWGGGSRAARRSTAARRRDHRPTHPALPPQTLSEADVLVGFASALQQQQRREAAAAPG